MKKGAKRKVAKEASDIILPEISLLVIEQGVLEDRRVFSNLIKYKNMAAGSKRNSDGGVD